MRRRDLAIAGITLLIVVVLGAVFAGGYLLATGRKPAAVASASPVIASPSPSPSPAPSPTPGAETLTAAQSDLKVGAGSDAGPGRGNGPGCGIWVDPGWTLGDCGIEQVQPTNPPTVGSVAWVTEHQGAGLSTRYAVFFMTTSATEAYWHTRLYHIDQVAGGGEFLRVTVKAADVTGDGQAELIVGFRLNTSAQELNYDIVQMAADHSISVVAQRSLEMGQAKLAGGGITDYGLDNGVWVRSNVTYSSGKFTATPQGTVASQPTGDFP